MMFDISFLTKMDYGVGVDVLDVNAFEIMMISVSMPCSFTLYQDW